MNEFVEGEGYGELRC